MNCPFERNNNNHLTDDALSPVRHIREAIPFVLARYMSGSGPTPGPDRSIRQLTFFDDACDAWRPRTKVQAAHCFVLKSVTRK